MKCYHVMENMRVRTKSEENPKATAAIVILEISQISMVLCESCITIRAFLAEGKLNPTEDRLPRATANVASFFEQLKKLERYKGDDKLAEESHLAATIIISLKPAGSKLAEELVDPVYTKFLGDVFTHKYLQDASSFHVVICVRLFLFLFFDVCSCVS